MIVHPARPRASSRLLAVILTLLLAATMLVVPTSGAVAQQDQEDPVRILLFYRTQFHASHVQARQAINDLAAELADEYDREVKVTETEDSAYFTPENLANYDTLAFAQTGGVLFNDAQRDALQGYIQDGGGWMGIHYTAWTAGGGETEHDWDWYNGLVGANSVSHPENPALVQATLRQPDPDHPLVADLEDGHQRTDEWYDWVVSPAGNVKTLVDVDTSTYASGQSRNGTFHPITWCQAYDGGRSWFTAMGHEGSYFSEPYMRDMLRHGLEYTSGLVEADCSPPSGGDVGAWSEVVPWSVMPINAALTHDGYVQTFGTVQQSCTDPDPFGWSGNGCVSNGAPFETDVWHYREHRDVNNYRDTVVVNSTYTDLFCSIQVHDPNRRSMLTMGGDDQLGDWNDPVDAPLGVTSYSTRDGMNDEAPMNEARWYPTATVLADGDIVVQGGSFLGVAGPGATVPERYTPNEGTGWHRLTGADDLEAYDGGGENRWWYPRAFVVPDQPDTLFNLTGRIAYDLDPTGDGEITHHGQIPDAVREQGELGWPIGATSTAVMYEPGKILQVGGGDWSNGGSGRAGARAGFTVDLTSGTENAVYEATEPMTHGRHWANSTLLPNGEVMVTGGGRSNNGGNGIVTTPEIWSPETGEWREVPAPHQHARLYHSTALLLPDARVMIGGGGAPGPRNYTDAEFYSPSYLYDGDELAERPEITDAPDVLGYDGTFDITVDGDVDRVTLVRNGSVTHSFNNGQLFDDLDFTTDGDGTVRVTAPQDGTYAPPGAYMLFVLDADGVPSEAAMVEIDPEEPMDVRPPLVVDQFQYPRVPEGWRSNTVAPVIEVPAGDGHMAPWRVGSTVELVRASASGMGGLGVVGAHLALGEDGSLERTIDGLVPGHEYRVSFRYARDARVTPGDDDTVAAEVSIADLSHTIDATDGASSNRPGQSRRTTWAAYDGTFTATSSSETLSFEGTGTSAGVMIASLVVVGTEDGPGDVPIHYTFDEGEGTSAANTGSVDRIGPATLRGDAGWSEDGVFDSALELPGGTPQDGNVADLPNDLLRDADDFTVSFWVDPVEISSWTGLFHIGNGEDSFFQIQTRTNAAGPTGLAATFKPAGGSPDSQERVLNNASTDLEEGRWNHVAFTREGTTGVLYLDGEEIASRDDLTVDMADIGSTQDNWIGRNGFPDDTLEGRFDDLRLYERAVGAAEVTALHAQGSALRTTTSIDVTPPSPSTADEPVTVEATVTDALGGEVEGQVELWLQAEGRDVELVRRDGPIDLVDGSASFDELELTRGDYRFEVRYHPSPGDSSWRASSAAVDHTVERAPRGDGDILIHYPFDEGEGRTAENIGAATEIGDATFEGNVTWVDDDERGTVADLPGGGSNSNYVALPNDLSQDLDGEFSVSLWTKPRALPQWVPLFQIGSGTNTFFLLQSNLGPGTPGGFGATFRQAGQDPQHRLTPGSDLQLDQWNHVVFAMEGSTGRIYFNGEQVAERTDFPMGINEVGTDGQTTANFLGNTSWSDPVWNGLVDDLRIYDYELTDDEIQTIYDGEDDEQPVETTTTASADEIVFGEAGEVEVTVTPSEATGTVEVLDGENVLGSEELSDGEASVTIPAEALAIGEHELDVRYLGTEGFEPSSTEVTVEVVPAADVETSVSATAADVAPGQDASVAVTVTPSAATGTVEVLDGEDVLGSAELSEGAATVIVAADDLEVGSQTFTVRYLGADGFAPSSTSVVVRVQAPPTARETVLSAAAADVEEGEDASVVVTIAPRAATGTVEVVDGDEVLGTAELAQGRATVTIDADDLEVGSRVLVVDYLGADGWEASSTLVVLRVVRTDPGPGPGPGPGPDPEPSVCDPLSDYDRGRFGDTQGSPHERNVLCLAELGLTEGLRGGSDYGPRREVNRGQMASYIARFIEAATGEELEGGTGFRDVPTEHAHASNIAKLAAIGVTEGTSRSGGREFAPQEPVSRGQMASFISRALTYVATGRAQPETVPARSSRDRFRDDDGSIHEANINALAQAGIVAGFPDGSYRWQAAVTRDQMASFVVRAFDHALVAGFVTR